MASVGSRVVMALVGVGVFAVYAVLAGVLLYVFLWVWAARPDPSTTVLALVVGTVVMAYLSYRIGTAQLLAALDAVVIPRSGAPGLYRRLDDLVTRMDVAEPLLAVGRLGAPNAFAIGGRQGVIVMDAMLFAVLDPREVTALLAHELAHLERRDAFVQTLAVTAVNAVAGLVLLASLPVLVLLTGVSRGVAWVAGRPLGWATNPGERVRRWVVHAVFAGLVGLTLVAFAHSRRREYAADDRAVAVTGDPAALATALTKIERATRTDPRLRSLLVKGEDDAWLGRLFSTHPPTTDRVDRLRALAGPSEQR